MVALESIPRKPSQSKPPRVTELTRSMISQYGASLPFPGEGDSLSRWQTFMAMGATDLSAAKIVESHFDALAIIHEAEMKPFSGIYGVWASKFGGRHLRGEFDAKTKLWTITGQVAFASGASFIDYALIPVETKDGEILFQIPSSTIQIEQVDASTWHTPGMMETDTAWVKIVAQLPETHAVGNPGFYLQRRGFWIGGSGVAAVWLGAAQKVFETWQTLSSKRGRADPFEQAARAECFVDLKCCSAVFLQAAALIDDPNTDVSQLQREALMIRHLVDRTANRLLEQALRHLGPASMIAHADHSKRCLDLQIFTRQCHGERDLVGLCRELDNAFAAQPIGAGKVWFA